MWSSFPYDYIRYLINTDNYGNYLRSGTQKKHTRALYLLVYVAFLQSYFAIIRRWCRNSRHSVEITHNPEVMMGNRDLCKWRGEFIITAMFVLEDCALECEDAGRNVLERKYEATTRIDAESTFVQSTRMQRLLKTILTLSCWYSLDSSHWVLSYEYPFARVSIIFKVFCINLYWPT